MATIQTINSWFQTGDIPTQEQFQQTFSSFRHKDDLIPILDVLGLDLALQNKLGTNHTNDANAHNTVLAKLDASNLNYENTEAWRLALGVGDIPDNVALVDMGESQEVFNKEQVQALYMAMADYVLGGKIRADKIESLGLTELITATETTLATFVANSGNYIFEKNDFIAIAINGNYSLYLFKGGDKSVSANYLPTGLTNITISMVEDLQASLDSKMGKIYGTEGSFFLQADNNGTNFWRSIVPSVNCLLFWNGSQFNASNAYFFNNKIGLGTTTPSEQLHLTARARMLALVLEDTAETLPQQITYNNRKFWGTDSTGTKKQLLYKDFTDYKELWQSFTDAEKTTIKTIANGGWTTSTMNVSAISPQIIKNDNSNQYVTLRGVNLNLNSTSFAIYIMDEFGNNVIHTIPNNQVQLYPLDGTLLSFFYNFQVLPIGKYTIRLWNGVAFFTTTQKITISDTIEYVDFSGITWNVDRNPALTNDIDVFSATLLGNSVNISEKPSAATNGITTGVNALAAKSNILPNLNVSTENFVLEISINNANRIGSVETGYRTGVGLNLGLSFDTPVNWIETPALIKVNIGADAGDTTTVSTSAGFVFREVGGSLSNALKFIIVKDGNNFTITTIYGVSIYIQYFTISSFPTNSLKLAMSHSLCKTNGTATSINLSGSFISMYKF